MSENNKHQKLSDVEKDQLLRDEELRNLILSETNAKAEIEDPGSDASLEKLFERRRLIDGGGKSPVEKIVLRDSFKPYIQKFPIEFYEEIYKLKGWKLDKESLYNRPGVVGKWTNEIIYSRFPEGTLGKMREKNPYTYDGGRMYKHFQLLNELGELDLELFIGDAIRVMRTCSYWNQFKRKFAKEFGLPYQGDLFDHD
jgi:hypothetical protein